MNNADLITWTLWAAGGGLGLLGLMLLYRALFHDRSRGRERCPKCWYDLSGRDTAAQCPECGREIRARRSLHRTRRRWWLALIALVLLASAWPVSQWERIKRDGWLSVTPTTALILSWPFLYDTEAFTPVADALKNRTYGPRVDGELWDWQWRLLFRVAARDAQANPDRGYFPRGEEIGLPARPADRWMKRALFQAAGRDRDTLDAFLARFPPEVMLLDPPRERWPEGSSLTVRPRFVPRWGRGIDYAVNVEIEEPSTFGVVSPGVHYLRGTMDVALHAVPSDGDVPLTTFHLVHVVTVEGTIDDVVAPVRDAELDAQLARGIRFVPHPDFPMPVYEMVFDEALVSRFDDVCFAFRVAWFREGREIAVSEPTVVVARHDNAGTMYYAAGNPATAPLDHASIAREPELWSFRLIPDQEAALSMSTKPKYWAGDVTIGVRFP
ncbi:MAG: hypothetical protein ACYTGP_03270 [Planctomycetota bacterium]